jgi:hypothetical protein
LKAFVQELKINFEVEIQGGFNDQFEAEVFVRIDF